MSYLIARVVVTAPPRTWIDEVIASWEALAPRTAGRWQVESTRHGDLRFSEQTTSQSAWPRLADELRRGALAVCGIGVVDTAGKVQARLEVELVTQLPGPIDPLELSERIYPGLPALLESERRPRCVTVSARAEDHALLEHLVVAMYRATEVCWAQIELQPHPAWSFEPQWRTRAEWEPYIQRSAADAAWLIALGPGQLDALGGMDAARRALAGHAATELTGPEGRSGLLVKTAPLPVASSDARVDSLRTALAPILLRPPIVPATVFLVEARGVDWRGVPVPRGVAIAELPDGFFAVSVGREHRRPEENQELADAVTASYVYLQQIGVPLGADRLGPSLLLVNDAGHHQYMRLYPGVRLFDTGERASGELRLTVFATGRASQRLLEAFARAVAQHTGATGQIADGALRCVLPAAFSNGEPLLRLMLALDRAAVSERGARALAAVLGDIISTEDVIRSFAEGCPRGFGPVPP